MYAFFPYFCPDFKSCDMTALVTGATSGFGEAIAHALARAGYALVITGRREDRLAEVKRAIETETGARVLALGFDIHDREACRQALGNLPAEFAAIDVLVNNAGLAAGLEHLTEGDTDDWNAMIDTNIKGVLYTTRLVAPGMEARGRGHIVNLGSIAGTQVYENGAVYCATKHALHALSQGMRIDLLHKRIKVTEIRPGMAETEFSLVRFHGDAGRAEAVYKDVTPLTAEDVAGAVLWALSQPAHVNVDEIVLTCVNQANAFYTDRNK